MPPPETIEDRQNDPLMQYVATVHGLRPKLARINANQQDVAASLSRAAAALRSLADLGRPGMAPVSGK